ncbi:MAG: hypothetical protein GKR91_18605 [Pseudomonadales bacterium]|nr:hypothetical protein [Pseudomonadales bacterium]
MQKVNKQQNRLFSKRKRLKKLGKYAPQFSLALDLGIQGSEDYFIALPFKRSVPAMLISGAFFAIFTFPLYSVGSVTMAESGEDLFSLVVLFFSFFWMLGWSTGVAILGLVFLAVTFGRETLRIRNNELILRIGIPAIGLGIRFHGDALRYFRRNKADALAGTSWRGDHLCFDYGGEQIEFGSLINETKAEEILSVLKQAFPKHADEPIKIDLCSEPPQEKTSQAATEMVGIETPTATWTSLSSLALIAANLIPLGGILLLDWRIGEIMLLFWAESAVIGFYTLCKMWRISSWGILFYGPFFVGHYGAFMVGHLLFIYGLFASQFAANGDMPDLSQLLVDFLTMAPALIAFLLSHGISFFTNFIDKNEYAGKSVGKQMQEPYKRIIIMHVTIIFGGFLVIGLGTPLPALLLLIVLKLIADLKAHLKEHSNLPPIT